MIIFYTPDIEAPQFSREPSNNKPRWNAMSFASEQQLPITGRSSASLRTLRLKYIVFSVIAAMFLYVLYKNEQFLIDSAHPVWQHYEPFKWWLLPHGVAGLCALVLAPLQF